MNWTIVKRYDTWAEFRDKFYYPCIVGRKWNGRANTKMRVCDQSREQEIHDQWRVHMGYDAPWTDVMLFYDYGKVIGLGEIKRGAEWWADANKKAAENCAERLGVPLVLMRFWGEDGPIDVSMYRIEEKNEDNPSG